MLRGIIWKDGEHGWHIGPLSLYWGTCHRWLRLGRYVLYAAHTSVPLLFSERMGYRKNKQFGSWRCRLEYH